MAIVDGVFLLVLDLVRDVAPKRTIQLYYHLDAPAVTWDADQRAARTANADVNVAIFTSPNVHGTLLDGRISNFLDVARPSTRLLLEEAAPPTGTTRLYAAAIVPPHAASLAPALSDLQLAQDGERIRCGFTLDGRSYRITWAADGLSQSRA